MLAQAKVNSVFSFLLRTGSIQAISFLESLLPFYRFMTGADIPKADAWKKTLTYSKAVF